MELRDLISGSKPIKIQPSATASDALVSMMENKTDYLLVDRATPNDAYGIITRWDIVAGVIANGRDLASTSVLDVARKPLVVMNNLDLDFRWAAKKMTNEGVSRIAVFDKESFLGFVSDVDILRAIVSKTNAGKGAGQ
jgi:signal-transduction protein with cAMP-binding, CBS, and nucleotidyltransferase domain